MSDLDYDMDSFDLQTFDPVPKRRAMRPALVKALTATQAIKAKPKAAEATVPTPDLTEALLAEIAARRLGMAELEQKIAACEAGMAELEQKIKKLAQEMRRARDQNSREVLRFTPAAGFGKQTR